MTTLFEINKEILERKDELQSMLDNNEMPTLEQAIAILNLEDDLENKLIGYAHVAKQSELNLDSIDSEIKRLTALKKREQNRNEWLKRSMIWAMQAHGIDNIKNPTMPIKLKNNPPSVIVECDIEKLPTEFIREKIEYSADKTALGKAIKNGLVIDGVRLENKISIKIG